MTKFQMAVPKIIEGKLLPITPQPSRRKRVISWLTLQADLIADEVKMACYRGKRKAQAELSNALTLARFISPALKVAAIVIISDALSYTLPGVTI